MIDARPIGDLVREVVEHAAAMMGFQATLNACDTADERKILIMDARERGMITDSDAELLIQAYGLETA
jgi:hypothetical protein